MYFARPVLRMLLRPAVRRSPTANASIDIVCTVAGGGLSGQAGAVRHGISKALTYYEPEPARRRSSAQGFLTRDSRVVERKKYGRKAKARRSFQFSKR